MCRDLVKHWSLRSHSPHIQTAHQSVLFQWQLVSECRLPQENIFSYNSMKKTLWLTMTTWGIPPGKSVGVSVVFSLRKNSGRSDRLTAYLLRIERMTFSARQATMSMLSPPSSGQCQRLGVPYREPLSASEPATLLYCISRWTLSPYWPSQGRWRSLDDLDCETTRLWQYRMHVGVGNSEGVSAQAVPSETAWFCPRSVNGLGASSASQWRDLIFPRHCKGQDKKCRRIDNEKCVRTSACRMRETTTHL